MPHGEEMFNKMGLGHLAAAAALPNSNGNALDVVLKIKCEYQGGRLCLSVAKDRLTNATKRFNWSPGKSKQIEKDAIKNRSGIIK